MNYKKILSIVLGCLLLAETPFNSQAASISPVNSPKTSISEELSVSDKNGISGEPSIIDKADAAALPGRQKDAPDSEGGRQEAEDRAAAGSYFEEADAYAPADNGQEAEGGSPANGLSGPDEAAAADGAQDDGQETDGFQLNYSTYNLAVGEKVKLSSELEGHTEVDWASDQEDVASVAEDGTVTGLKKGEAVITATFTVFTEDGIETSAASCQITVGDAISLNKTSLTLYKGKAKTLKVSTTAQGAVTWFSSDPEVAAVDQAGRITALKPGTAQVTAEADGVAATCKVVVKEAELKLDSKATVYLNSTLTLKATAAPAGTITWKSSNTKVAKVTSKGKVKPVKTGTVTITATCNGLKKQCKVTVKKSSVKLNTQETILFENNKCRLKAAATPVKELEWVSSNSKIAKVDKNGTIVGLKAGKAKITAVVPGAKATCEVQVISSNYKLNHSSERLMQGKSAVLYLKNISGQDSVSFSLSNDSKGVAKISVSGNECKVTAKKAGEATLKAAYKVLVNGQWVKGESECAIEVIDSGIVQQQASVAVKAKKSLTLKNIEKEGNAIVQTVWASSAPNIVQVSGKGVLTGRKEGSANVTATVSYADGTAEEYLTKVRVSKPEVASKTTVISLGKSQKVKVEGLNAYSTVDWKVADSSLASVDKDGQVTVGNTAGKTELVIVADGKTLKEKLVITNPQLKSNEAMLATGKTKKIPITGASSKSKITYISKNESIATISKAGVIKGKSSGKTKIVAKVDGVRLVFQVRVVNKRALSACAKGLKIINSSRYSQARRMSKGYYDCSALVFRAYGCDSGLLGGMPSWAPTAAAMASHLESTGKVISYGGVDVSKLLPGDLIFYSSGRNGRYRNIYHVSMYYGNGYRLEKPLRAYNRWGNIAMIARPLK